MMRIRTQVSAAGLAAAMLALTATPVLAGVAGTGTASIQVNFLTQKLGITATFANQAGELPGGVNLGTLDPFQATNVSLTNPSVSTGASFQVPFGNATDSFRAVGDVACPASGCATIPGRFSFVGTLDQVNVDLLDPDLIYTFDGSNDCTGNVVSGVSCTGPFALNFFTPADVPPGASVEIPGSHRFFDPALGQFREFDTRITLSNVSQGGTLDVTFFSRLRGAIPAPYVTSTDGFNAVYFDVATGAIFTDAEVCVVVDADRDGVVDGTQTAVSRLAGLHFVGNAFVLENIRIDDTYACLTVSSLSPFALVASPPASTTSTTTTSIASESTTSTSTTSTSIPTISTTSSTVVSPSPTTTTIPVCATARDCLGEIKANVECPEGLPPKLGTFIDKKVGAARAKLDKAESKPTKVAKFSKQARTLLGLIDKKAAALAKKRKNGISAECRQSVTDALAPALAAIGEGSF